jgi:tetratricopeptide (TPR) repeat protein
MGRAARPDVRPAAQSRGGSPVSSSCRLAPSALPVRSIVAALLIAPSLLAPASAREASSRPPRTRSAGYASARLVEREVRSALGVPPSWHGAPPVDSMTLTMHRLGELKDAAQRAADAADAAPEDRARAHAEYANALVLRRQGAAAAAEYLLALEDDPTLTAAWSNLGSLLREVRAWRPALRTLDIALRQDPQSGSIHFKRAMVLQGMKRPKQAEDEYLRALQLDPSLWLPSRNPLVVGNESAANALHAYYLKNGGSGAILLDAIPPR